MSYVSRDIEKSFLRMSQEFGAVLLTGPRQVGKTTMLEHLASAEGGERGYVSLDDLDTRAMAQNDPKLFLQMHPPPVIIDEIQYAPQLFPYVKVEIDKRKLKGGYWLTGSQLFKLMQSVQESLAGRVGLLQMLPFSQRELYDSGGILPFDLNREHLIAQSLSQKPISVHETYSRIFNGGMPAIAVDKIERGDFFPSYLGTYIERDIRQISDVLDPLKFNTFITSVAARSAQQLNYSSLALDADIDIRTAKRWLSILEALGIVFFLHPFANNTLKRTIKSPKLYFFDTGLAAYLTKWESVDSLSVGAMSGAILENYVVTEIVKSFRNFGREPFLAYYRDKEKQEIDLILEKDGKVFPIEIKRSVSPSANLAKVFKTLDKGPWQRSTGAIICLADNLGSIGQDALVIPVSYL